MNKNLFGPPPEHGGRNLSSRIENSACRAAMRAVGANIPALTRSLDVRITTNLTFSILQELTEFPHSPAISAADKPDSFTAILYYFPKTTLWRDWVAAWDARPLPPRERFLVFRGTDFKTWIMYHRLVHDGNPYVPRRSHLTVLSPDSVHVLLVERFLPWCQELSWRGGEFATPEG